MKRLALSTILGIVFPVISFIAIGSATDYMQPSVLTEIIIYDEPAPGLLLAPFSIPIYFDILARHYRIATAIFDTFWFRLLSLILFNWLLYGIIIYILLGCLKRFRKQPSQSWESPPPPNIVRENTTHNLINSK